MNRAFTLIEMLVVLAIIGITTGAGFVTYNRSTQEKILVKDTEALGNLLSTAKELTIRRDISLNPTCAAFRGYDIQFTSTSSYRLRMICRAAGVDTFVPITNYTYTIVNNIFVTPPASVPFYYPYGCLDSTYPNSNCAAVITRTITIKSLTNRCITTTVNNLGLVTTTDPVGC